MSVFPEPVRERDVPPHFCADYCLRCNRNFMNTEVCCLVTGGKEARYRDVGIIICKNCGQGSKFDRKILVSVYLKKPDAAGMIFAPRYVSGTSGVTGYAALNRLSCGSYRLGLHRGHVEVWSFDHIVQIKAPPGMGYSKDFTLYGPTELVGTDHVVVESKFIDLIAPNKLVHTSEVKLQ